MNYKYSYPSLNNDELKIWKGITKMHNIEIVNSWKRNYELKKTT